MRSRAGHCRSRVLCLWRLPYTGLCLPRTIRLVGTEGDMDQACLGLHWRSHLHRCKRLGVRLSRLLLSRAFFHTPTAKQAVGGPGGKRRLSNYLLTYSFRNQSHEPTMGFGCGNQLNFSMMLYPGHAPSLIASQSLKQHISRIANILISALKPKQREVRSGSKTEMPGFARRVRFTLRSRHRQPAPACPFGANFGSAAPLHKPQRAVLA